MNSVFRFIKTISEVLVLFIGFYIAWLGVSVMNMATTNSGGPGAFALPGIIVGPVVSIVGLCMVFGGSQNLEVRFKYIFAFFSFISFFILSYNLWFYPPYDGAYFMLKKQWGVFPSSITEHFISFTLIGGCLFFSIFQLYKSKFCLTSSYFTLHPVILLSIGILLSVLSTWVLFFSNETFMNLQVSGKDWSWQNIAICVAPLLIMLSGVIAFSQGYRYFGFALLLPSCMVSWMYLLFYLVGL